MRTDVAKLLDRLGRRDFSYQEFGESFGDVEFWPIFEALLQDPRIYLNAAAGEELPVAAHAHGEAADPRAHAHAGDGAPHREAAQAEAVGASEAPALPLTPAVPLANAGGAPMPAALADLFARYAAPGAQAGSQQDIRAILQRLADHLDKGDV